jgi:hypothetical protein
MRFLILEGKVPYLQLVLIEYLQQTGYTDFTSEHSSRNVIWAVLASVYAGNSINQVLYQ